MTPINFIDPTAKIGQGTKLWHFCVVLSDVVIGANCSIGSHCEIGRGSIIGDNSRFANGVFLPPNSRIGSGVFIGPGVTFTDDRFPVSGNAEYTAEPPIVEDNVSIGAGVVVLPGVRIEAHSMIGAGSVVDKDVATGTILRGLPSRIMRKKKTGTDWTMPVFNVC